MGVSTVSLIANNQLWGLIALHDFGPEGRRVSPPLRQLCRLVGESASTHLERILLKERVEGRKIVEQSQHRTGGYVATPEEMLDVFDADSAALCINSGVKVRPVGWTTSDSAHSLLPITAHRQGRGLTGDSCDRQVVEREWFQVSEIVMDSKCTGKLTSCPSSILHTHELIKDFPEILVSGERLHDIAGFLAVP